MTPTQTDSFVPLTTSAPPSPGKRTEFKATVMSQPGETQKFQSIAMATSTTAAAAKCEPRVNVQRDGNRVAGIQIQCSCGEVIELACVYEAAAPPAATVQPVAAPEPATLPQTEPAEAAPGKKGKEAGKVLPASAAKKPKLPEKGRGTSAAKRRSA
jgi:hypothetical protein